MMKNNDEGVSIPIDFSDTLPVTDDPTKIGEPGVDGNIDTSSTDTTIVDKKTTKVLKKKAESDKPTDPKLDIPGDPKPDEQVDPDKAPDPDEDDQEGSFIEALAKKWGIEFEEGEKYEDSEEGLEQFIGTIAERRADDKLNGFFEQYPKAGEFFDFLAMGGKEEDFFRVSNPEIDFKGLDIKDAEVQKSVLRTWYRKNDYNEDEIQEALKDMEVSGIMEKQATIIASKLSSLQEKDKTKLIEDQKKSDTIRREKIADYWNNIDKIVKAGKIKDFVIPEKERKELLDYMSKPVKPGKSQEMLEAESEDYEAKVLIAFLRKKKFDLSKYVQTAAATQRATGLTERLKQGVNKLKSGDPRDDAPGLVIPDIDLKHLTIK